MYQRAMEDWLNAVPLRRQVVAYVRAQGLRAYLVGGTVRDILLGRQSCDLDIAIEGEALALARQVADSLHAAYVPLDAERGVARVVVGARGGAQHLDFAKLRASDIEADLWARDFTVNAMAMSLQDPLGQLLDPTGGRGDLAAGVLRIAREDAFKEDPLRILRGVRLRGSLSFSLTPETEALARSWLPALTQASPERIRDELVQILTLQDSASSLAYAGSLGVLLVLFPELGGPDDGLGERAVRAVASLEDLFGSWTSGDKAIPKDRRMSWPAALETYRPALARHWAEELSSERKRWIVLKLAAFLSVIAQAAVIGAEVSRRLCWSLREIRFVGMAIAASAQVRAWEGQSRLSPVTIYRYYRHMGDAGVDGALLSLAMCHAELGRVKASQSEATFMSHVEQLLDAWFEQRSTLVNPTQLLSGHDLQRLLKVPPGRRMGQLLQALREAQVLDLIHTPEEALEYLHGWAASKANDKGCPLLPDTGPQGQYEHRGQEDQDK